MSSSADQQNPRQTITSNLLPAVKHLCLQYPPLADAYPSRQAIALPTSQRHSLQNVILNLVQYAVWQGFACCWRARYPGWALPQGASCWHSVTGITCLGFCGQTSLLKKLKQNKKNMTGLTEADTCHI